MREISSCSCLTTLPDPAWVLLSKVCIHFTRVLQNYKHLCIQHKNIWLINPYWEHLKAAHDARIQTLESAFFIPPYRCYIRNYDHGIPERRIRLLTFVILLIWWLVEPWRKQRPLRLAQRPSFRLGFWRHGSATIHCSVALLLHVVGLSLSRAHCYFKMASDQESKASPSQFGPSAPPAVLEPPPPYSESDPRTGQQNVEHVHSVAISREFSQL